MAAISPPGWTIPNADAQDFSFVSTVNGVNSLSDQALSLNGGADPKPVILPDNSPGNVSETRVEFAAMLSETNNQTAGIVFGYQDIDNYVAFLTNLEGFAEEIIEIYVLEKVNGSINTLANSSVSAVSVSPQQGWVDIRLQVFRPSSSEVSFRASAADHGNAYQPVGTATFQDSGLSFTSGDVGLTCGLEGASAINVAFDGDAVGSGGRPIKMYWA